MDPSLARLRDPDGGALRALAQLVVDDITSTPVRDIAAPRWVASQVITAAQALTRGDLARDFVGRRLDAGRALAGAHDDRLARALWPHEVDGPLRQVLAHPWSPDADITFRILDQPALRHLVAEVLTTMLVRFRKRARGLDGGLLKGLGGRAAARGRSLFGGMADLAENVVGAVKDEVEHSLDELVKEFVEGATRDAVRAIAAHLAAPEHERAFAELRVAVLDVLLDTPVGKLTAEIDKAGPLQIVDVVLAGIRAGVDAPDAVDRAEQALARVMDEVGDGTLGAWLDEVGLREVWASTTVELVATRLRAVVATEGFEAWWRALHAD